jgi:hypothetical protein
LLFADLLSAADALHRCAIESCRQHQRASSLLAQGASDVEVQVAWQLTMMCDALLQQMADAYAPVAARSEVGEEDEIRRRGNALWQASRAFANRFLDIAASPNESERQHSSEQFVEFRLKSELDASSILFLKQAADSYAATRNPDKRRS